MWPAWRCLNSGKSQVKWNVHVNLSSPCFRRVRDKYESELNELEESERNMQEKYNSMKVKKEAVRLPWFT